MILLLKMRIWIILPKNVDSDNITKKMRIQLISPINTDPDPIIKKFGTRFYHQKMRIKIISPKKRIRVLLSKNFESCSQRGSGTETLVQRRNKPISLMHNLGIRVRLIQYFFLSTSFIVAYQERSSSLHLSVLHYVIYSLIKSLCKSVQSFYFGLNLWYITFYRNICEIQTIFLIC